MDSESCLRQKLSQIWPHLNERSRRLVAAAEAVQLGRGGVSLVSRASGLSRVTVTKGIRELGDETVPTTRVRREGAGRPSLVSVAPNLPGVLEALVEPLTRGDPESPLRWTCKSNTKFLTDFTIPGILPLRKGGGSHESKKSGQIKTERTRVAKTTYKQRQRESAKDNTLSNIIAGP